MLLNSGCILDIYSARGVNIRKIVAFIGQLDNAGNMLLDFRYIPYVYLFIAVCIM